MLYCVVVVLLSVTIFSAAFIADACAGDIVCVAGLGGYMAGLGAYSLWS
jgi:hypothetical protein